MVYWSIEPPGLDRVERAIAVLTLLLANVHSDPRKGKSFHLEDFLPDYWKEPEPEIPEDGMSPERIMNVMEGFMRDQEKREKTRGAVIRRPK